MGPLRCPENPIKQTGSCHFVKAIYPNPSTDISYEPAIPAQPHFIPGYTGFTPGCGPHRHFVFGNTFGQYTHELMHGHRVAGGRLNPLCDDLRFVRSFAYPPYEDPKRLLDNPHRTLDPHFIPGYTGWTPGSAIQRSNAIGDTYGRMTHVLLAKDRVAGDRLRPVHDEPRDYVLDAEEVKFYCHKHEITGNDIKRRNNVIPGYAGHLPRAQFRQGKTRTKIGCEATAEFEKIMEKKIPVVN